MAARAKALGGTCGSHARKDGKSKGSVFWFRIPFKGALRKVQLNAEGKSANLQLSEVDANSPNANNDSAQDSSDKSGGGLKAAVMKAAAAKKMSTGDKNSVDDSWELKKCLSILVVDDAITIMRVMKMCLEREGHKVAQAINGEIALSMMQEAEYDIVLMDVKMPLMDGTECTRQFRSYEDSLIPRRANRQIIIGMSGAYDRDNAIEAGMDAFIAKPFSMLHLRQLIHELAAENVAAKHLRICMPDGFNKAAFVKLLHHRKHQEHNGFADVVMEVLKHNGPPGSGAETPLSPPGKPTAAIAATAASGVGPAAPSSMSRSKTMGFASAAQLVTTSKEKAHKHHHRHHHHHHHHDDKDTPDASGNEGEEKIQRPHHNHHQHHGNDGALHRANTVAGTMSRTVAPPVQPAEEKKAAAGAPAQVHRIPTMSLLRAAKQQQPSSNTAPAESKDGQSGKVQLPSQVASPTNVQLGFMRAPSPSQAQALPSAQSKESNDGLRSAFEITDFKPVAKSASTSSTEPLSNPFDAAINSSSSFSPQTRISNGSKSFHFAGTSQPRAAPAPAPPAPAVSVNLRRDPSSEMNSPFSADPQARAAPQRYSSLSNLPSSSTSSTAAPLARNASGRKIAEAVTEGSPKPVPPFVQAANRIAQRRMQSMSGLKTGAPVTLPQGRASYEPISGNSNVGTDSSQG